MSTKFPYLTQIELILTINLILDLQHNRRLLSDKAYDGVVNPRQIDELCSKALFNPLKEIIGNELTGIIERHFDNISKDYIKLMTSTSVEFLSRQEVSDILVKDFFVIHLTNIFQHIWQYLEEKPSLVTLFSSHCSNVKIAIDWLDCHSETWQSMCNQIDDKSRLYAWKRGENIPTTQYIKSLPVDCSIKVILLLASAIDRIKKHPHGTIFIDEIRVNLWRPQIPVISHNTIKDKFIFLRSTIFEQLTKGFFSYYRDIDTQLKGSKKTTDKERIECELHILEGLCDENKQIIGFRSYVDWLRARFLVLSGELVQASEMYQQLFDVFMYMGGSNQELILEEALVVTANLTKPDNIFLKKLKWAAITFGYDIPSTECSELSNRFEGNIQDWEIEMWKNGFYTVFPKEAFFLDCKLSLVRPKTGPLVIDNSKNIRPNYRRPNRKIPIGDTWQKKMPQLIWFIHQQQYEEVQKLLDCGASINVVSDAGETPLMMAIEIINNAGSTEPDLRFFNLVSEKGHSEEIVNFRMEKLKKSALFLAIETGIPEVVKQVLELGADPNLLASCDRLSPLYYCMSKIVILKQSQQYKKQMLDPLRTGFLSEYHIDAIKRYSNGAFGFSNQDIILDWQNQCSNPIYKKIFSSVIDYSVKHSFQGKNLENYRKIAMYLIDKGASVNCEHTQPIKGYTPFMYAAEINEVELFQYMHQRGGDLSKTYWDSRTNKEVDIKDMASYFKSQSILDFLKTLKQ